MLLNIQLFYIFAYSIFNPCRKMKPTKANRTGKATAADVVYTNPGTAKWIVNYFSPTGSIIDPSAGSNAFYNNFQAETEIQM